MIRHTTETDCEVCRIMLEGSKALEPEVALQLLKDTLAGHKAYSHWSDAEYRRLDPDRKIGFRAQA